MGDITVNTYLKGVNIKYKEEMFSVNHWGIAGSSTIKLRKII